MSDSKINKDKDIFLAETSTRLENLEDRFDRHLFSMEKKIDTIFSEMHSMELKIMSAISSSRENQLKDDRATQWKIIAITGGVSAFISAATSFLVVLAKLKG